MNLDGASPSLADVTFSSTDSYTLAQGSGGTLQLANGGSSASISITSGSDAINAPVVLDDNVNVTAASGTSLTISGAISQSGGSYGLTLSGGGSLTLSGANTYTGGTTVSGGTLDIAAPSALSGSGLVTIAAGGRLVLGSGAGIGALLAASSPAASSGATTASDTATPNDAAVTVTATASNATATPSETAVPVAATTTSGAATPGAVLSQQVIASHDAVFSGPLPTTVVALRSPAASEPSRPTEAIHLTALAGVVAPSAALAKPMARVTLFHLPPKAPLASSFSAETQRTTASSIDAVSSSPSASGVATVVAPTPSSSLGPAVTVHKGRVPSPPRAGARPSVRLLARSPNGLSDQGMDEFPAGA